MQSATGRAHAEGEVAPGLRGARSPRLSVAWKNKMVINQNTTVRVTFFLEVMKVGQDVMRVAAMSREILAFESQNREAGAFSSFLRANRER
jgi:hypothetical protein